MEKLSNADIISIVTGAAFLCFLLSALWFSGFWFALKLLLTGVIVLGVGTSVVSLLEVSKNSFTISDIRELRKIIKNDSLLTDADFIKAIKKNKE